MSTSTCSGRSRSRPQFERSCNRPWAFVPAISSKAPWSSTVWTSASVTETYREKTIMATSVISPDKDVIFAEIFVAAPPERVFEAISDPQQLPKWWGQDGIYRSTKWEADMKPGGKWRCDCQSANRGEYHVGGEFLEIDPPRALVYTWIASWSGPPATTVRWELKSVAGGTQVSIRHSGFQALPEAARAHAQGWSRVLAWMQAYVEKGETADTRKALAPGA